MRLWDVCGVDPMQWQEYCVWDRRRCGSESCAVLEQHYSADAAAGDYG
jgi:hypothetical protein